MAGYATINWGLEWSDIVAEWVLHLANVTIFSPFICPIQLQSNFAEFMYGGRGSGGGEATKLSCFRTQLDFQVENRPRAA